MKRTVNPPTVDTQLTQRLIKILEQCFAPDNDSHRKNDAQMARLLGINVRTFQRISMGNDPWPWWPTVLYEAVLLVIPAVKGLQKRTDLHRQLRALPEQMQDGVEEVTKARAWLIDQLKDGPALSTELMATGNRGILKERAIRRAAKTLGVKVKRIGKGKAHEVTWSLPKYKA